MAGTTINVGRIEGGTTPNVVPDRALALIDVRVSTNDEALRVETALRSLRPIVAGTALTVTGGLNRPPMERTPAIAALFEKVRDLGQTLGFELTEGSTGGGSDGNFTAALGIPTLDGLGASAEAPMPRTSTSSSTPCPSELLCSHASSGNFDEGSPAVMRIVRALPWTTRS